MTTLNDARFDALRGAGYTGATNDMILAWLQDNGATSSHVTNAWLEMLAAQGFDTGVRNDDWYAYLDSLAPATIGRHHNDLELWFWENMTTTPPPTENPDENFGRVAVAMKFEGEDGSQSFSDQSIYGRAITVLGGSDHPQMSTEQFQYGTSSVKFSGTAGEMLSIDNASAMSLGVRDFTIEMWVYKQQEVNHETVISKDDEWWVTFLNGIFQFRYRDYYSSGSVTSISAQTVSVPMNTWSHVAVSVTDGTLRLFINGVEDENVQISSITPSPNPLLIGDETSTFRTYLGFVDDLRFTAGVGRYTANFTPEEIPVSGEVPDPPDTVPPDDDWPWTVTAMNFEGTDGSQDFTDLSRYNLSPSVTGTGPTISTTEFVSGTSSFRNNGVTGEMLLMAYHPRMNFGNGDYTVEAWVFNEGSANSQIASRNGEWTLNVDGQNLIWFWYIGGEFFSIQGVLPSNAWHHVAIVHTSSNNTISMYIDGTLSTTGTQSDYLDSNEEGICIGNHVGGERPFTGYIDDFRVTVGRARYTGDFTPEVNSIGQ